MYRASLRSSPARLARALRPSGAAGGSSSSSSSGGGASARRLLGTAAAAAPKRGSWKGTAARWGLAAGGLYWYNTSPIFADETARVAAIVEPSPEDTEADLQTIDALLERKQKQELERAQAAAAAAAAEKQKAAEAAAAADATPETAATSAEGDSATAAAGSPEALEAEAGQQGAFNPETGEINWDCPCLGGMAHGPCGEDFKAAFSCFVYSAEEPKGMDCIDKFQHMQDCFRQYPEIYGAELDEDEAAADGPAEGAGAVEDGAAAASVQGVPDVPAAVETTQETPAATALAVPAEAPAAPAPAAAATPAPAAAAGSDKFPEFESDKAVPKQAWDATAANTEAKA